MTGADAHAPGGFPAHVDVVFFDFDGVLADSVEVKGRAFGSLFSEYGSDVVSRVMRHQ